MKVKRTTTEMFPLIEEWQKSGKGQKSFTNEKGIAPSVFLYWLKKYRQQETETTPSAFIDLKINHQQQESNTSLAEVELPNGQRLRFSREIAEDFFHAFIKSQRS